MSDKRAHSADRDIAEELRLRPERPKVMRLSRRVLIGLGAISSAALLAALFFALESGRNRNGANKELLETEHKTLADGLAGLPRDYSGLPNPLRPTFRNSGHRCRAISAGRSLPHKARQGSTLLSKKSRKKPRPREPANFSLAPAFARSRPRGRSRLLLTALDRHLRATR